MPVRRVPRSDRWRGRSVRRSARQSARSSGGLAGKGVAESIDPTVEDAYWRDNYASRPYADTDWPTTNIAPLISTVGNPGQPSFQSWDQAERELEQGWHNAKYKTKLGWDKAKLAARDAWERVDSNCTTRSSRSGNAIWILPDSVGAPVRIGPHRGPYDRPRNFPFDLLPDAGDLLQ